MTIQIPEKKERTSLNEDCNQRETEVSALSLISFFFKFLLIVISANLGIHSSSGATFSHKFVQEEKYYIFITIHI